MQETGIDRIGAIFEQVRAEGRAALMPYFTLGYPTYGVSLDLVEAAAVQGADLLELGVPFSDPLADGPIIQRATQVALEGGMSVPRCLEAVIRLRQRGISTPLLLMGYYNPIVAYGEGAFCQACHQAGVDGLIVPDLPPEEGDPLERGCVRHGLALIYFLAPTSPPERVRLVSRRSRGFVYLVSVTGITGPREQLPPGLVTFIRRVRAATDKPLAVGFGIATPEQAGRVAALADGVIVGSALVRLAGEEGGRGKVADLVGRLRKAVNGNYHLTNLP